MMCAGVRCGGVELVYQFVEEPVDDREHHAKDDGSAESAQRGSCYGKSIHKVGAEHHHQAVNH